MRILQIISGRNINGALIYCKLLSDRLRELGHEVTILVREDSWLIEQLENSDLDYFTSDMSRFPLSELKRISRWIRDNRIDVVHTHMSRGHSFGVMLKMLSPVPIVATAHARSFQLHWKMNDFVIANSQATAEYQHRVNRIPNSKLETIHCFVDLEKFNQVSEKSIRIVRRQLRVQGDEFVVGIVGEVVQRKGHLYLFRALQAITEAVPKLKLVILGRFHRNEAYTQQMRSILIQNRLFRRTKWLGLRFNIQDFMSAFDLCVVPSIEEPLGMVAIESMASGTPVVATNVGGLPEIVKHESNGLLVEPRDSDALAEAIIRMAHDHDLRQRLGENGQKMVSSQFDPLALTEKVVAVYRRTIVLKCAA